MLARTHVPEVGHVWLGLRIEARRRELLSLYDVNQTELPPYYSLLKSQRKADKAAGDEEATIAGAKRDFR